jgi:hypothetical protein
MIKTGLKIAAVLVAFLIQITVKAQITNTTENQNATNIFPKGEKAPAANYRYGMGKDLSC